MSEHEIPHPDIIIPHDTPPDVLNRIAEFRQDVIASPNIYHKASVQIIESLGDTALRKLHISEDTETDTGSENQAPAVELARSRFEDLLADRLGRYLTFDPHTDAVVDSDHGHEALHMFVADTRRKAGGALSPNRDQEFVTAIHASRLKIFTKELMLTDLTKSPDKKQLAE